ncbi:hypothetical protein PHISP_06774 [Aspergillus sp. HF37]|nr:hypothetical protein PHISP_06774 [Aspergillus sp. HF37]
MPPNLPLPLADEWSDAESYVEALLSFATSSVFFRQICGGVHILDFLTREPDLYTSLIPEDWRAFFDQHDIQDILDLLLRDDIQSLRTQAESPDTTKEWRGDAFPPTSLVEYIHQIRRLSLGREFVPPPGFKKGSIPTRLAVGMRQKKYHEVENFANYVDSLCTTVAEERGDGGVSHIVDFGSGQNYLGRMLASAPYDRHIIAIERQHEFISGAKGYDVQAKLEKKATNPMKRGSSSKPNKTQRALELRAAAAADPPQGEVQKLENGSAGAPAEPTTGVDDGFSVLDEFGGIDVGPEDLAYPIQGPQKPAPDVLVKLNGSMNYIEHEIQDGYLEPIIKDVVGFPKGKMGDEARDAPALTTTDDGKQVDARAMVISLHSCGNLLHHGIRSLVLNPSVVAIAMIGCCYNLMSERLGPATYKLPALRSRHPYLTKTATAYDPHGFPMSKRLESYPHAGGTGVKLNVTARSMALQAPSNWSRGESENFFTRHFYRALLQRVLQDRKVVPKPVVPQDVYDLNPSDEESSGNALTVGSMRKSAFTSFSAYLHAAVAKLSRDAIFGEKVKERMSDISEEEIDRYVAEYWPAKKNLSIVWSLMAFSAVLAEAIVVVDRWQFLREHDSVKECWVEPVFNYAESPRNLAVIGIKK